MDKKELVALVEGIVNSVKEANPDSTEAEARTLVGGLLRRIAPQIVLKLKTAELTLS